MLSQLTYKQKFLLTILFSIIFLFIAYRTAIRKTIDRRNLCDELKSNLELVQNAPQQIAGMQLQLEKLNSIIGRNDTLSKDNWQQILEITANYCKKHKIDLIEISDPLIIERGDYIIETNKLELEGPFIKINRFIYLLEQQYNIGHVISTEFKSRQDIRTKRVSLRTIIFLQNIKKKNYEI